MCDECAVRECTLAWVDRERAKFVHARASVCVRACMRVCLSVGA